MGCLQRRERSGHTPQNQPDMICTFQILGRMAERKRAQAAKAMEKKTMNPKVFCTTAPKCKTQKLLGANDKGADSSDRLVEKEGKAYYHPKVFTVIITILTVFT